MPLNSNKTSVIHTYQRFYLCCVYRALCTSQLRKKSTIEASLLTFII